MCEKLTSPPILAYADYTLPFILHTDASNEGLGVVLYQKEGGIDRVIAYGNRSLRGAERLYPAHKQEFLALKWAVTDKQLLCQCHPVSDTIPPLNLHYLHQYAK
jgi:hypothetical protein